MRTLLVLLALLAAVPAAVFAQATPAPSPMYHRFQRPDFQAMRQMMQRLEALHKQFRANVLAALTPAHHSLLASLVGQLAIAPSPDPQAAARKLDAALSSAERQRIASAEQSFRSQQRAPRDQMMAQLRRENPDMPSPLPFPMRSPRAMRTPDPGELLLALTQWPVSFMGQEPFMMEHGLGPPGYGPPRYGPPGGFRRRPRPAPTTT